MDCGGKRLGISKRGDTYLRTRLVHGARFVVGTVVAVNDVTQASALVHGEETDVFADVGYQGVTKLEEVQGIDAHAVCTRQSLDGATLVPNGF